MGNSSCSTARKGLEKLDPKDFIISKRTGESITKQAGSINGQQFNIEECKDCDIFLLDYMDSVFMDDCENCRVFFGPVESSIFIRTSKSCDFVIACKQFRCRDCADCRLALMCTTEPVIETSKNMQFACFEFFYFSLAEQIRSARLNIWNNKWWQIHDFNANADKPNWSLLPQEAVSSLLRVSACSSLTQEELEMDRVVPVSLGSRPRPSAESCFVVFLPGSEAYIEAFFTKIMNTENWALCRSRSTALADDRAKQLFAWTKEPLAKSCKGQEIVGVEVCGPGVHEQVKDALQNTGLASGSKHIHLVPESECAALSKGFFEIWKDEI